MGLGRDRPPSMLREKPAKSYGQKFAKKQCDSDMFGTCIRQIGFEHHITTFDQSWRRYPQDKLNTREKIVESNPVSNGIMHRAWFILP
jgi:hypothetical protein